MEGTGLKAKHFKEPEVEVWPENWPAVELFSSVSTQWRVGAAGAIGLDYAIVYREIERRGLDHEETMWRIGVIEVEALERMHEK